MFLHFCVEFIKDFDNIFYRLRVYQLEAKLKLSLLNFCSNNELATSCHVLVMCNIVPLVKRPFDTVRI
jgi:hypothetical protein